MRNERDSKRKIAKRSKDSCATAGGSGNPAEKRSKDSCATAGGFGNPAEKSLN